MMMKSFRIVFSAMLIMLFMACSDDENREVTVVDAQKAYNEAKGTYAGVVLDENVPVKVNISLGDDLTIRYLPVTPLLSRFFSGSDLDEAVASVKGPTFSAPTVDMALVGNLMYVSMEPTDWMFTAKVGGVEYRVSALLSTTLCYSRAYDKVSVSIGVDELFCEGQKADLSSNSISWLIDEAARQ
jgi:hypothetical protein